MMKHENLPQLFMRNPDIKHYCLLTLPNEFSIHTHIEGCESNWENIIENAFGSHYSFDDIIRNGGDYDPKHVLYLSYKGEDVATATAVEKNIFPGEGWLRMVGTIPKARGKGIGRLICVAALHSLCERGYTSAVLSTDDERIPAIKLYLSLGFEPIFTHNSHKKRWEAVFENLNKKS